MLYIYSKYIVMNVKSNYKGLSGIYCIKNLVNGKFYIGSSKNIYFRLGVHKSTLKHNNHRNRHLQASVNKHGIEKFSCFLMLICKEEDLIKFEDLLITTMKPHYNQRTASCNLISEELRERIRNTLKERYKNGLPVQGAKKVLVYDRETAKYLYSFSSIRKTAEQLNLNESSVRYVLLGSRKFNKNFIFRFESDSRPVIPIIVNPITGTTRFKKDYTNVKEVKVTNIVTNELLIFRSVIEASNYFGLSCSGNLNRVIKKFYNDSIPWRKQYIFNTPCSV